MEVFTTPEEMRAWSDRERRSGHRIGVVPTMGALHAGHRALVHAAFEEKDYSTFNFLQWYVAEQHEEEKLFNTILDKIRIIGTEGRGLYHFDEQMRQMSGGSATAPGAEA